MKNTSLKAHQKAPEFVTILGVKVNSTPRSELLKEVQAKLSKKMQFYIVTPNPEIILEAQSDPELAHSLNSADFSIPDGVGLKIMSKARDSFTIIKGREFMLDLFKLANDQKLKVYLLGSTPEINKKALNILISDYPKIIARGNSGPILDDKAKPVSKVYTSLQFEIVKEINSFKPDLLFVAYGAPKQEKWISQWLPKLKVTGAMTVGGSLDYFSNSVLPVPNFFANLNLEWLWRLIQDPGRIGRIFNALIVFPVKVVLEGKKPKNQV